MFFLSLSFLLLNFGFFFDFFFDYRLRRVTLFFFRLLFCSFYCRFGGSTAIKKRGVFFFRMCWFHICRFGYEVSFFGSDLKIILVVAQLSLGTFLLKLCIVDVWLFLYCTMCRHFSIAHVIGVLQ
jgi:hypothetical protein